MIYYKRGWTKKNRKRVSPLAGGLIKVNADFITLAFHIGVGSYK